MNGLKKVQYQSGASGPQAEDNLIDLVEPLAREQASQSTPPFLTNFPGEVLGDPASHDRQRTLSLPLSIMTGGSKKTPGGNWQLRSGTVGGMLTDGLLQHPVKSQKDGLAYVWAVGQKSHGATIDGRRIQYAQRFQDSIEQITAFVVDVDGTAKASDVADKVYSLGLCGVVYTTPGHHEKRTENGDRFRVVIFLEEPIRFPDPQRIKKGKSRTRISDERRKAIDEYHSRYAGMCERLGLEEIDGSGMDLHHMQYAPRRLSEDAEFEHYFIAGKALRYEDMPLGDASKYRKKGRAPSGAQLSAKVRNENAALSDGLRLAPWWYDGGRFLDIENVLDAVGWDVRGASSNGWVDIQCPNSAQHSDPDDDTAGILPDGDDGWAFHCFHDHCGHIGPWEMLVLVEKAIQAGEACLPDGYDTFSELLCDPCYLPDEVDGEPIEMDPVDYGARLPVEITYLGSAKKVRKAFEFVSGNKRATEDNFASLYASVEKAGNAEAAVSELNELLKAHGKHDANKRKQLAKRGSQLLKEERNRFAAEQGQERRREAVEALARDDLAHPSMDPAEPLHDSDSPDLEHSLATLSKRYVVADLNGKFRVIRKPDLSAFNSDHDSTIIAYQKQDFIDLHADRQVLVGGGDIAELVNPARNFLDIEKRKSGIVFAPHPQICGANDFNMYQGRRLTSKAGDWDTLNWFIKHIVCDGDADKYRWLILWMAHMVQFPGEKPGTAVIATGEGGVGKGTLGAILMRLTAPHTKQLENESHVIGQFAGEHLSKCILVVVNEAVFGASRKVSSTLKSLADSSTIQVEAKGMSLVTVPSYMRLYFDSNDKVPVRIEGNGSERRYFVIRFSDEKKQDLDYFAKVREAIDGDEMSAFLHFLEEYEPASAGLTWNDVRTAPETAERVEMGVDSMRPAMLRLKEILEDGEVTLREPEGLQTYTADDAGLRVPVAEFRQHIQEAGDMRDAEDRDFVEMFSRLFPGVDVNTGQGKVGGHSNKRWVLFPPEALGVG